MNYCQTNRVQILAMLLIFVCSWATLADVFEILPTVASSSQSTCIEFTLIRERKPETSFFESYRLECQDVNCHFWTTQSPGYI